MKVLFVTRGFPSDDDPMSGNYEAVQAKAIASKGVQVGVVTVRMKSVRHLFKRNKTTHRMVNGISVYERIGICFSTRFWQFLSLNDRLRCYAFQRLFRQYIDENGLPDIIHAHILFCGYSALSLKQKYNRPLVITEHWSKAFSSNISNRLRKMSSTYSRADCVICVSQVLADSLKRNFQVDSIVINNMVSDLFFNKKKNKRSDGTFRFIACGAFRKDRNKGFDILVDAFALGQFPPNIYLDIIGDGPDRSIIESKIVQHGLDGQVRLLGVKTPEEVSDILCNSDCFVLSSRLETFSIVIIEAMAKGLPVIATRCGGPETFLLPEHGLLIEKENMEQLILAMKYMIDHYQDYNSDDIRQFCFDHFSQDVIANQIIKIYTQLLS